MASVAMKKARVSEKIINTLEAAKFFTHAISADHLTPFVVGEKTRCFALNLSMVWLC
jgi:hypothetical protein